MTQTILVFGSAFLVALVLTPVVRRLALARRIGSVPNGRTVHRAFMPSMGGVAIYLGFCGALALAVAAGWVSFATAERNLGGLVVGGTIVMLIGLYDDVRGASCYHKFLGQILASLVAVAAGFRIDVLTNPFGPPVELGILAWPFTVFWITGMCNAVNLIDGLDGLAAGVTAIAAATILAISVAHGDVLTGLLAAALFGAALGFLRYNFAPASLFMGDTGSLFLGFLLACLCVNGLFSLPHGTSSLIPIVVLFVPVLDTSLAIFRRLVAGTHPFVADKRHIHHRLYDMGMPHRQVVLAFYAAAAFLGVLAYALPSLHNNTALLVLLIMLGGTAVALIRRLGYMEVSGLLRRRNGRV